MLTDERSVELNIVVVVGEQVVSLTNRVGRLGRRLRTCHVVLSVSHVIYLYRSASMTFMATAFT